MGLGKFRKVQLHFSGQVGVRRDRVRCRARLGILVRVEDCGGFQELQKLRDLGGVADQGQQPGVAQLTDVDVVGLVGHVDIGHIAGIAMRAGDDVQVVKVSGTDIFTGFDFSLFHEGLLQEFLKMWKAKVQLHFCRFLVRP